MVTPLLLVAYTAVGLQFADTTQLPIPFTPPQSPYVRAEMVRSEKLLAKSSFAEAKQCITGLSLTDIRWSLNESAVPEPNRAKYEKAIETGLRTWLTALGPGVKCTKVASNANFVVQFTKGYSRSTFIGTLEEPGKFGCEDFDTKVGPNGARTFLVTMFTDEGSEGTPHTQAEVAHLAARALGAFLGLRPAITPIGIMGACRHIGLPQSKPLDQELESVKSVISASAEILRHATSKTSVKFMAPSIAVDKEVIDLGVQAPGTAATVITVKNVGNATLRIPTVTADCRCVAQEWDPEVAPGKTGTVRITVDTSKMIGTTTRRVVIVSNDPEVPTKKVTLNIVVMRAVSLEPGSTLIDLPPNAEGTFDFFVYSPSDVPFKIVKLDCTPPYAKANYEAGKRTFAPSSFPNLKKTERSGYVVRVTLPKDTVYGGPFNGWVQVQTDSKDDAPLMFSLLFSKGIQIQPGGLQMVSYGNPEEDRRSLSLEWAKESFQITGVEVSPPELTATVETLTPGHKYRVWLTPKPGLQPHSPQNTRVLITTDSQYQAKIQAGVYLSVMPPGPGATTTPEGAK